MGFAIDDNFVPQITSGHAPPSPIPFCCPIVASSLCHRSLYEFVFTLPSLLVQQLGLDKVIFVLMAHSTYDKFYLEEIYFPLSRLIIAPKLSIERKRGAFYVPHKLLCAPSPSLPLSFSLELKLKLQLKVASFMACARFDLI